MVYEGFAEYAAKKILDHALGKTAWTMPTNVYVALYNGDPLGAGSELADPPATDYAREQCTGATWVAAAFASPTAESVSALDVDFGVAGSAWGTVNYVAIFDAATAGNMIAAGPLEVSRSVQLNDPVKFPAGELKVRLTQATV
jgi:hypothetical protein